MSFFFFFNRPVREQNAMAESATVNGFSIPTLLSAAQVQSLFPNGIIGLVHKQSRIPVFPSGNGTLVLAPGDAYLLPHAPRADDPLYFPRGGDDVVRELLDTPQPLGIAVAGAQRHTDWVTLHGSNPIANYTPQPVVSKKVTSPIGTVAGLYPNHNHSGAAYPQQPTNYPPGYSATADHTPRVFPTVDRVAMKRLADEAFQNGKGFDDTAPLYQPYLQSNRMTDMSLASSSLAGMHPTVGGTVPQHRFGNPFRPRSTSPKSSPAHSTNRSRLPSERRPRRKSSTSPLAKNKKPTWSPPGTNSPLHPIAEMEKRLTPPRFNHNSSTTNHHQNERMAVPHRALQQGTNVLLHERQKEKRQQQQRVRGMSPPLPVNVANRGTAKQTPEGINAWQSLLEGIEEERAARLILAQQAAMEVAQRSNPPAMAALAAAASAVASQDRNKAFLLEHENQQHQQMRRPWREESLMSPHALQMHMYEPGQPIYQEYVNEGSPLFASPVGSPKNYADGYEADIASPMQTHYHHHDHHSMSPYPQQAQPSFPRRSAASPIRQLLTQPSWQQQPFVSSVAVSSSTPGPTAGSVQRSGPSGNRPHIDKSSIPQQQPLWYQDDRSTTRRSSPPPRVVISRERSPPNPPWNSDAKVEYNDPPPVFQRPVQ